MDDNTRKIKSEIYEELDRLFMNSEIPFHEIGITPYECNHPNSETLKKIREYLISEQEKENNQIERLDFNL